MNTSTTFGQDSLEIKEETLAGYIVLSDNDTALLTYKGLLDLQISYILEWITWVILAGGMSIFGIITNIINIVVFLNQGVHKEYGSINLLGLAISDFFCVLSMMYFSFCYSIILINPANWPWAPFDFKFATAGWPHFMFAQITRTVTAFISLERCVCVVWPFKVRSVFTPKRSAFIIASIFVAFGISYSPAFIKQRIKPKFDAVTNSTILKLDLDSDWMFVVDIMWYVNSLAFNVGSVLVVLISTAITVSRVRLSSTWRENATKTVDRKTGNDDKQNGTSGLKSNCSKPGSGPKLRKEKRLIRMITTISSIFLLCYIPDFMFLLAYSIDQRVRILGQYHQVATVMYGFTVAMETTNSSINIFIYYRMSSKYRRNFRQLMGMATESDNTSR